MDQRINELEFVNDPEWCALRRLPRHHDVDAEQQHDAERMAWFDQTAEDDYWSEQERLYEADRAAKQKGAA